MHARTSALWTSLALITVFGVACFQAVPEVDDLRIDPTCPEAQTLCVEDGLQYCAALDMDEANCGACGTICASGLVCSSGACTAPESTPDGGGTHAADGGVTHAPDGGGTHAPDGGGTHAPDGGVTHAPDGGGTHAPAGSGLALGLYHSCMLHEDETVSCWGNNQMGQIGDGTRSEYRLNPTPVLGLTEVVQLAAGAAANCALRRDGTVWCWGNNGAGELARGTTNQADYQVARVQGLTDVDSIDMERYQACALRRDGTVWCWGTMLGAPQTTPQQVTGLTGVTQVTVGNAVACALMGDSSLRCWGTNFMQQLGHQAAGPSSVTPLPFHTADGLLTGVVEVAAGVGICARTTMGRTLCWGWSLNGPAEVTDVEALSGAVSLHAYYHAGCVRLADQSARCWASKRELGGTVDQPANWQSLGPVLSIAGSMAHFCAIRTDGNFTCWGRNYWGNLGTGDLDEKAVP